MWGEAVPASRREEGLTREGREAERPKSGVEQENRSLRKPLLHKASRRSCTLSERSRLDNVRTFFKDNPVWE